MQKSALLIAPKAAYLLSLSESSKTVIAGAQNLLATPLYQLPVASKIIAQLERCGFEQLGDIIDIPLVELGSRFGVEFVSYIEQLLGVIADPQQSITPPKTFEQTVDFAEPISNTNWIAQQQQTMLRNLIEFSLENQLIYEHMAWSLKPERGAKFENIIIELNAKSLFVKPLEQQLRDLDELVRLKFETLNLSTAFTQLSLSCTHFTPVSLVNRDLFDEGSDHSKFNELHNKLTAKLGHKAVYQLETRPEVVPEYASKNRGAFAATLRNRINRLTG